MPESPAIGDPALLEEAAARLAAGARALSAAGAGVTIAVPGWSGAGANGQAMSAVALRERLDTSCDAFGLAAGALRQYASAVRTSDASDAARRAASVIRAAAAMAPAVPIPTPSQGPAIELVSRGSAFDDVLGAGKSIGHGVGSLGGDAVSAGKDVAHLGESAAGEIDYGLRALDDATSQALGRMQAEWSGFHDWLVSSAGKRGWKSIVADVTTGLGGAAGLFVGRRLKILVDLSRLLSGSDSPERTFIPYESRFGDRLERGPSDDHPAEIHESELNSSQRSNYDRFTKKLPKGAGRPAVVRTESGRITFSSVVPGRVPGSYAIYAKTVDSSGKTLGYTKATVLPDGTIAHVKDKMPK